MTAQTIVGKTLHNAMRCFDRHLWFRQAKSMKELTLSIREGKTTVLQKLYDPDSWITANKYREALSKHLGKVDLDAIVEKKASTWIRKTAKYKGKNVLAWDASDIFKPHAQAMQWISKVRDGSTGLIGNGYVVYGININGITHQIDIKDPSIECIGSEKWEIMLKKSALIVDPEETIAVFDRGHDDVGFIDILKELGYHFVVRGRKNRIVQLVSSWNNMKVGTLPYGKYEVMLEWWTHAYLYIMKWTGKKPVILYSSMEFEDDRECLEVYLKRRKIEVDYAKMKSFWLEAVRLLSLQKIVNMMRIIQFLVMLWQDLYNEIMEWIRILPIKLLIRYKEYCRKTRKWMNPSSLLSFISEHLPSINLFDRTQVPKNTLFGNRRTMKKVGLI